LTFSSRFALWLIPSLAITGCASKNPNEPLFRAAARELPQAEAEAAKVGLKYTAAQMVRNVPEAQNAARWYRRGCTEIENLRGTKAFDSFRESMPLESLSLPKAQSLLKEASLAFNEFERGLPLPHCDWRRDYSRGVAMLMPEDAPIKACAKLYCLRARVEAYEGDYQSAGADLKRVARLEGHLAEQPTLIDLIVASALQATATRTAEEIITDAGGNPNCAKILLEAMKTFAPKVDPRDAIPQEATMAWESFSYWYSKNFRAENVFAQESSDPSAKSISGIDSGLLANAFRARLLQYYSEACVISGNPSDSDRVRWDKLVKPVRREQIGDATYSMNKVYAEAWDSHFGLSSRARQEVILVGLEILASSTPDGRALASKQLDPFTGNPLRFIQKPGGFIVYSVGKNLEDDHGSSKSPADDIAFEYPYKPPVVK